MATATEVATIGIAYAVLTGMLIYRSFDWAPSIPMLVGTASLSGHHPVHHRRRQLHVLGADAVELLAGLADAMARLPGGRYGFLVGSIVAFIVLGSVLEGIPAMVLFGPLLFPVAKQLGVNEVHYAMVVILAMGIGLFAPPFGLGYYAACSIGQVDPNAA